MVFEIYRELMEVQWLDVVTYITLQLISGLGADFSIPTLETLEELVYDVRLN